MLQRPWITLRLGLPMVTLALGLLAAGCATDYEYAGDSGGRIDPYRTTPADRASGRANIPSLLEFSELTAQSLARDLAELDLRQPGEEKPVLELGGINNQTRTPTTDFEMIQRRVQSQLLESPIVRDEFRIVVGRQQMQRELERVQAIDEEGAGTQRYQAGDTYVLLGDFYEANRGGEGGRRQYFFRFTLTNLQTREIVDQFSYDLGQM